MRYIKSYVLSLFIIFLILPEVSGQYFGRNKPGYKSFDFEVLESPNFDIYHYLENEEALKEVANWSEHWCQLHQAVLQDTIKGHNPLIIYNNHGDFQQTNAINSTVGVGTGGVTEAFKNRVIFPFAMTNQQTHHVLGHELVHAYQYNLIIKGDSTNLRDLANLPLWMVEGLAEYLSIGRVDAHTAMWMRDAVLQDDVPDIKNLSNPKYFPYRYGQAFWAFATGLKGDQIIKEYFVGTAKYGIEEATKKSFGMTTKELSKIWKSSMVDHYNKQIAGRKEKAIGKQLLSSKNAGNMNIAPVISPNGKYVIFLSEKNLFSIDLFLADAISGEVIRTVASSSKDSHIDDYNFIESAGTWSPDSKRFAFVAFKKGKNILIIKEVESGKTLEEFEVKGVPAFSNPAWSPDGRSIVVSGLVQGQVDLFQLNLKTKKVNQLTNDRYSELTPNWSPNGDRIVFATDRLAYRRGRRNGKLPFNISILNVEKGTIGNIDIFPMADNLNPVFDYDGNILFLSNRDGFRNMYKYETATSQIYQMTDLLTGISGITQYAPAISTTRSKRRNRIVYSHYYKNGYTIYRANDDKFLNRKVSSGEVDFNAAILASVDSNSLIIVEQNLAVLDELPNLDSTQLKEKEYQPKFKLDYVGGSVSGGVGTSNTFGTVTGASGGVDLLFSDMLGDHQLFTSFALNGELTDFGGVAAYINRKNRINWGLSFSHIPYRSAGRFQFSGQDTLQFGNQDILADHYTYDQVRTFEDKVSVFLQLPFSKTLRAETGLSYSFYNNRVDRFDNYYDRFGRLIHQERDKISASDAGYNLFNGQLGVANAALVGDNSYFGIASPLKGSRYRFGVDQYFGSLNFTSVTLDYRKYIRLAPVTLAFRAMHYGRYGKDADRLSPQFLGYPWYMRGYGINNAEQVLLQNGKSINDLVGTKIGVSSFEIRLPFTGPKQISQIKSNFFFSELALFADAGVAWDDFGQFSGKGEFIKNKARPLFSAGASMRINLFGALILEPYYAWPLLKETKGTFGINIIPGW